MDDVVGFDPVLAGLWPVGRPPGYGEVPDPGLAAAVGAVMLETKSEQAQSGLSAIEEMQGLLNDMTAELRRQFVMFQKIRERADAVIGGDEAEAKVAKADAKSAVDALALIVRTIEKIDAMQRGLADVLAREAEEDFDDAAYQQLLDDIERKICERAEERARRLLEQWTAVAAHGAGPPGAEGQHALEADAGAGGAEDRAQNGRAG